MFKIFNITYVNFSNLLFTYQNLPGVRCPRCPLWSATWCCPCFRRTWGMDEMIIFVAQLGFGFGGKLTQLPLISDFSVFTAYFCNFAIIIIITS